MSVYHSQEPSKKRNNSQQTNNPNDLNDLNDLNDSNGFDTSTRLRSGNRLGDYAPCLETHFSRGRSGKREGDYSPYLNAPMTIEEFHVEQLEAQTMRARSGKRLGDYADCLVSYSARGNKSDKAEITQRFKDSCNSLRASAASNNTGTKENSESSSVQRL